MVLIKEGNAGGVWLYEKRTQKGWSQNTLAERSGACGKSFISQIENNKYPNSDGSPMQPGVDIVEAWAEALGESKNEARRVFGYPEINTEASKDEVLQEFTDAVGRYKQLPEPMRVFFKRHVNDLLDLFIEVNEVPTKKIPVPVNAQTGDTEPVDQTVRFVKPGSIPTISLEDIKDQGRDKKRKNE